MFNLLKSYLERSDKSFKWNGSKFDFRSAKWSVQRWFAFWRKIKGSLSFEKPLKCLEKGEEPNFTQTSMLHIKTFKKSWVKLQIPENPTSTAIKNCGILIWKTFSAVSSKSIYPAKNKIQRTHRTGTHLYFMATL